MVSLEAFRDLYDYNYWARDRQLEACANLSEVQLLHPVGNSNSSLRDTLAHLLAAEWVWHEHFRGRSPRAILSSLQGLRSVSAIREPWGSVEADIRSYLSTLNSEALSRDFSPPTCMGGPISGFRQSRANFTPLAIIRLTNKAICASLTP